MAELPIYELRGRLPEVRQTNRFVLEAPTGSGKSTQIPQMLRDDGLAGEGQIIILQPRRMAARMLARRVAQERGGVLGDEVGYRARLEGASSERTRILYVTEGLLLRQLQDNPQLQGVSCVLFDEFHERHLQGDVSLALLKQLQATARPDLLLGVMSATLAVEPVRAYLGSCVHLASRGRLFHVEIEYAAPKPLSGRGPNERQPIWEAAALQCERLLREGAEGDILVFMPGAFEIRKTLEALQGGRETRHCLNLPLYGDLSPEAQDAAVAPSDRRKIVVATNIAETSLTIEGVRLVVDAGLARVARYDPRRGVNTLLVEPISRASADQRSGRAGRLGPGRAVRLWSEREHAHRAEQETPEIHRTDLSELLLLLKSFPQLDLTDFPWFDPPEPRAWERARTLLMDLGALNAEERLTEMGQAMARFPLEPRYSRLLYEAARWDCLEPVAVLCALSQGRPPLLPLRERRDEAARLETLGCDEARSDFLLWWAAWQWAASRRFEERSCRELGIHALACRQAGQIAERLLRIARSQGWRSADGAASEPEASRICRCLLACFADQLAVRRDEGTLRCRVIHGRSGEVRRESVVRERLFCSADIEERALRGDVSLMLGLNTAIEQSWLEDLAPEAFRQEVHTYYDSDLRRVLAEERLLFRDLVLQTRTLPEVPADAAAHYLAQEVKAGRLELKQWTPEVDAWIERVNFVARHYPDYEVAPIDEEGRALLLEQICHGAQSYKDLRDRPVMPILRQWLVQECLSMLDSWAPERLPLVSGHKARVRYENGQAIVSAKIQQFYDTPMQQLLLAEGRVRPKIEILAPNFRPVQLTDDLDAFWTGAYPNIKKELKGRYPKHEWR